jgi:hypothetical protein
MNHEGLRQTRHTDQEAMPPGEDGDQEFLDHGVLANYHLAKFSLELPVGILESFDSREIGRLERVAHRIVIVHATVLSEE